MFYLKKILLPSFSVKDGRQAARKSSTTELCTQSSLVIAMKLSEVNFQVNKITPPDTSKSFFSHPGPPHYSTWNVGLSPTQKSSLGSDHTSPFSFTQA